MRTCCIGFGCFQFAGEIGNLCYCLPLLCCCCSFNLCYLRRAHPVDHREHTLVHLFMRLALTLGFSARGMPVLGQHIKCLCSIIQGPDQGGHNRNCWRSCRT